MADDSAPEPESINRSDQVRHASDDARKAAMAKMQAALDAQERGEEIEVESAGIEASKEDAATSGGTNASGVGQLDESLAIKNVKVYSPFKVYYDSEAMSVSAINLTGPFDVLAGHKNFITLLTSGDVTIRSRRGEEKISIERGIMHVRDNLVSVFLDV